MPQARIFLSCGQSAENGELALANIIAKRLETLGFEVYVASEQTTLRGVKEAIFPQIRDLEYFLFIDFKREQFANSAAHRGSLITNQELALGMYFEKPTLIFQEEGVSVFEGLLKFVQGKPHKFSNRDLLPKQILDAVVAAKWSTDWHNGLAFSGVDFDDPDLVDTSGRKTGSGRFFHLHISNQHKATFANDCFGYLSNIKSLDTGKEESCNLSELKWAGTTLPSVRIAPNSTRSLDAFYIDHSKPLQINFSMPWTDSSKYRYGILGPGEFALTYAISSSSFPTISRQFLLNIHPDINKTQFAPAS